MKKPKVAQNKKQSQKLAAHTKRFKILKWIIVVLGGLFVIWCLGMLLFGVIYQRQHRNDKVIIGASFSKETAEDLGMDWKANYIDLLDDMKLKHFRLMSYWSQIEGERGIYNFEHLDWQFAEAEKRDAKVTLSIGLRQPRWPECHQAGWAKELYKSDYAAWEKELYAFITAVVDRYKDSTILESWHLENEYYNRNFGNCDNFSTKRLQDEMNLIYEHDDNNPIVLSLSDQLGFPWKGPKTEVFATSLYRGNYVKMIGYIPYPIPTHFYSAKAFFIKLFRNREIYIHELQLEPWGPRPTRSLTITEQDKYMNTEQIKGNINFGLQTGMKKMDLWGAEWWYWRKVKLNDPTIWNTVKTEISRY